MGKEEKIGSSFSRFNWVKAKDVFAGSRRSARREVSMMTSLIFEEKKSSAGEIYDIAIGGFVSSICPSS